MILRLTNNRHRSGQAVVFVLMALVVLAVAFLWIVDVHLLWSSKTKAQNAGDAAALAAAKWQGNTLNLIGELNLMHAIALDVSDDVTVDAITNMQARLCFTGPLTGLMASQVAARKNGAKNRDEFTKKLKKHAADVASYYDTVGGAMALPEPYPNAWREYQTAILDIAGNGIAAAPDNARFFGDVTTGHILLDKAFYDAIAGRSWCYFFLNWSTGGSGSSRTILDDFTGYSYFGEIPEPSPPLYRNSEIFGLGLTVRPFSLSSRPGLEDIVRHYVNTMDDAYTGTRLTTNAFNRIDNWYVYDGTVWENYWPGMTYGDEDFLPLTGSVKEEYNYTGADSVIRLYLQTKTFASPESANSEKEIVWSAAAKPFGYLDDPDTGSEKLRPIVFSLVLPAFRDVRLIPMDAATSGGDGAFDIGWRTHTDEHLPRYTTNGTLDETCRYCRLIKRFENAEFRKAGSDWLSENSHLCIIEPSPGGRHHGGGTRRGH